MMDRKYKLLLGIVTTALICVLIVLVLYMTGVVKPAPDGSADTAKAPESLTHEGYTLEQVVILSRHNIRSPFSGGDSVLGTITPHKWYNWTSPASQLSVRGGTLETCMGQYFRKWLESEGLFPENYHPDEEAVRIYANSMQRTIATAQFFTAGLLPTVNEDVEYHGEFNTMDPVFNPQITYLSDDYVKAAQEQIHELYDGKIKDLADNYELVSDVIDMEDSAAVKDGTVKPFRTDDTVVTLEKNKEPSMEGSLKTACSVSDALTLQYYEEEDPVKAAFGNPLNEEQWTYIADIKDVYNDVLFAAPLISYNVANPLLKEIYSEMNNQDRQFTFLCGHDSNIGSVLSALNAAEYDLPGSIEQKAPIGVKLVLSKWKSKDGAHFWDIDLVYQTAQQLRDVEILTEDDNPASVDLELNGLRQNDDSLYKDEDLKGRLKEAIAGYDKIQNTDEAPSTGVTESNKNENSDSDAASDANATGKKVYFAGPLFSQAERDYNLKIAKVLEDHGYQVFLPQRDGFLAPDLKGKTEEEKTQMIFAKDESEVRKADILFMVMDGRIPDEGACVELGIAYANDKRCYGFKTDARAVEIDMDLNPIIRGCFVKLFENTDGDKLVKELEEYLADNEL